MQNITVSSGQARLVFKYLEWDSNHFGRNCYALDETISDMIADAGLPGKLIEAFKDAFVTVKLLTTSDPLLLQQLQSAGFRYIETEITLKRSKFDDRPIGADENVSHNSEPEIVQIVDQAGFSMIDPDEIGRNFSMTRFHRDPLISSSQADGVWIEYLKNYTPSNERFVFAALVDGKVIGSILVNNLSGSDAARVFYVAVSKDHRGKGIGKALMGKAIRTLGNIDLYVGTQVSNIDAMNFYLNCGFRQVHETRIVLHYWKESDHV